MKSLVILRTTAFARLLVHTLSRRQDGVIDDPFREADPTTGRSHGNIIDLVSLLDRERLSRSLMCERWTAADVCMLGGARGVLSDGGARENGLEITSSHVR